MKGMKKILIQIQIYHLFISKNSEEEWNRDIYIIYLNATKTFFKSFLKALLVNDVFLHSSSCKNSTISSRKLEPVIYIIYYSRSYQPEVRYTIE